MLGIMVMHNIERTHQFDNKPLFDEDEEFRSHLHSVRLYAIVLKMLVEHVSVHPNLIVTIPITILLIIKKNRRNQSLNLFSLPVNLA